MEPLKRLKGYQKIDRKRHFVARDCQLDDAEYRLWDLIGACTIWDSEKETFLTLEATQVSLASVLGWSVAKVSRRLHSLYDKGLISIPGNGVYEVHFLPDLQLMSRGVGSDAGLQKEKSERQSQVAPEREDIARMQKVWSHLGSPSLGAFKVNVRGFNGGKNKDSFNLLDEDDIEWLNKNVI